MNRQPLMRVDVADAPLAFRIARLRPLFPLTGDGAA